MNGLKQRMVCALGVFMAWSFIFGIYIGTLFSNYFSSNFLLLTIIMIIDSVVFVIMIFGYFSYLELLLEERNENKK